MLVSEERNQDIYYAEDIEEAISAVKKLPDRKALAGTERLHGFDYALKEIEKRLR